jgi:heme oxygenase (biliverdin-IX-beta and delta-forming)
LNLEKLKAATRPQHEATESLMPEMGPGLTRDGYVAVLRRLYPVVRGWEDWARAHAPADLAEMVEGRQRAPLLEADLRVMAMSGAGEGLRFAAERIPALEAGDARFRAGFLGAMYVMEGSTLGGQYIARQVEETLGLRAGEGDAYFRGYGERTGEMWRAFRAVLVEVPEDEGEVVITAAKAMFAVFGDGLQGSLRDSK